MPKSLSLYVLGGDLAVHALCVAREAEARAGTTAHGLRETFEDAIDLLQRQAKRAALLAFDEARMRDNMDRAAKAKH